MKSDADLASSIELLPQALYLGVLSNCTQSWLTDAHGARCRPAASCCWASEQFPAIKRHSRDWHLPAQNQPRRCLHPRSKSASLSQRCYATVMRHRASFQGVVHSIAATTRGNAVVAAAFSQLGLALLFHGDLRQRSLFLQHPALATSSRVRCSGGVRAAQTMAERQAGE